MLSQLCKAKPWFLHSKGYWFGSQSEQHSSTTHGQSYALQDTEDPVTNNGIVDNHCQLLHCSFCDYRVCCLVTPCSSSENSPEISRASADCSQITENPAYGLTTNNNWLEYRSQTDSQKEENLDQQIETNSIDVQDEFIKALIKGKCHFAERTEKSTEEKMNYINIKPCSLESIPECWNENGSKQNNLKHDCDTPLLDSMDFNPTKHSGISWSVLKHRHTNNDNFEEQGQKIDCAVDNSRLCDNLNTGPKEPWERKLPTRQKYIIKDKTFSRTLIKSHSKNNEKRQLNFLPDNSLHNSKKVVSENGKDNLKPTYNAPKPVDFASSNLSSSNKLSEITSIKTEESIQQWLTRISEWVDNNSWENDNADQNSTEQSSNNTSDEEMKCDINESSNNPVINFSSNENQSTYNKNNMQFLNKITSNCTENLKHQNQVIHETESENEKYEDNQSNESINVNEILCKASKHNPANIPMVVMQCSRLHSHITSKPPFQQTSLPMGTLVTALYKESDWLYIQTPHGVEGFVNFSNCIPIGTTNEPSPSSKRPWEPCDFPIQINSRRNCLFEKQHHFMTTKLSVGKCIGPFVSMVKMKTNFYNDRYFNNTFKPKDSIKTAQTVTDILRSSPETKITN